jgi:ParB family chromosome partitioning protein
MQKEIVFLPIESLDDFPSFPFRLRRDEEFLNLLESISSHGVLQPIIVRPVDERYQIISGHRRKRVCEILHHDHTPGIIYEYDEPEATLLMLDSNLQQRQKLLPSEKAFAYKMKLEALNKLPGRPRKNLTPVVSDFRTNEQFEDSREQVRRFVRLTFLVPELLEFVDEERIKMRPAVELSYLDEDCQRDVVDFIDENESTPSHAQAIILRRLFNEGVLNREMIYMVLAEQKGNQKERLMLPMDKIRDLIPETVPVSKYEEYI